MAIKVEPAPPVPSPTIQVSAEAVGIAAGDSITIDVSLITGKPGDKHEHPLNSFETFSDVADLVFFKADGKLKPHTYGKQWVLRDASNQKTIKGYGMTSRKFPKEKVSDTRSLKEVGIKGGMILEAVRIQLK